MVGDSFVSLISLISFVPFVWFVSFVLLISFVSSVKRKVLGVKCKRFLVVKWHRMKHQA